MDICLLSITETARLERHGIWPNCRQHRHIRPREADTLTSSDLYRYVGGLDTVVQGQALTMITEQTSNEYVWRNRPSGGELGFKVRQFVPAR